MIPKVGSAGPMIESIISYNGNRQERIEKGDKDERADKANKESKALKLGDLTTTDRVVKASESFIDPFNNKKVKESNRLEKLIKDDVSKVSKGKQNADSEEEIGLSKKAVEITVEDVNEKLSKAGTGASIEFNYHEKTGRYSFKILDDETGEIIREVPPEKSLDMVAKMFEMVGILVDKKL